MVIPYHSSGMNPVFAKMMGSDFYRDYTDYQNTTVKQLYNSEGQPVSLNLEKKQTEKLTGGFMWNKVLQETGDARAAAEAYKDWCADASKHTVKIDGKIYTAELNPKFADFKGETNYYKLLTDFNPYDCITEEAAPQDDVQQVFPQDFEKILRGELTAQEAHRQKQEKNQAFDKAMGEIEDYLKSHKTEKQLHEAGMKQKVPVLGDKQSPATLTEQDLREILQNAKEKKMDDGTYFPVRINTPDALLNAILEISKKRGITNESELAKLTADRPVAMQVFKARKSMATEETWDGDGTPHNLSIDDIIGLIRKMDRPEYIVYEDKTGRYVEILKYSTENGKTAFAVVELENFKGEQHLNGYSQDTYNILVTLFQPDTKKRISNLLNGKGNIVYHPPKENGDLQLTSSNHVPSVLNKSPFAINVPQDTVDVNGATKKKTPVNQEISTRTLLEKALENPDLHEVLKKRIQDYVANDDAFQKEEAKLTGLREEIRDLSLANRKEDAANMGFPKGTQEMWEYITQKKKP